MRIIFISLILTITSVIIPQTFGRIGLDQELASQQEMQALESFEETFALEKAIDPANYILGSGDELGLNILTSQNITWPLTVTPTGDLFIPSVGIIHVAGISLEEATVKVRNFIVTQAYPNSKVTLALINLRQFKVQVSGAVNQPGFVTITPVDRLSDVIKKVGNFHQFAREYNIIIYRKEQKPIIIDYFMYWQNGDLAHNPSFLEGDVIQVPFGNIETEGIVIRGSVTGRGYDIIKKNETLENYIRRKAKFATNADLESVTITRRIKDDLEIIHITPDKFHSTLLEPRDAIDILGERGVTVNGYVQVPGGYSFLPGFSVSNYISIAGGNTPTGDADKAFVRHLDGSLEKGQMVLVRRGDVIVVPRTIKSVIFGNIGILQIVTSLTTIYLTYIAATK
ncbi:MAG: SLBB domain-containing protein [Candidatus Marinimicrobia bacterium]|nr:SLBB domain-containing protein [Candidatus Neomarinimicrobiota bacterium]